MPNGVDYKLAISYYAYDKYFLFYRKKGSSSVPRFVSCEFGRIALSLIFILAWYSIF